MTLLVGLAVAAAGVGAGALGALLGIGGGVFLVPFLVIGLHFPMQQAVGVSLATVIASSSAVSARTAGRQLINIRLGVMLEVATALGGLLGSLSASAIPTRALVVLFSVVTAGIAVGTLVRISRRNILDDDADPGRWGGRFFDEDTDSTVSYRVQHLPVAIVGAFAAGNLSSLLGIGGGVIKVPLLNLICGVPIRVAAATSALMIGVTAASGAIVYYGQGLISPAIAAAAVLGVRAGSLAGMRAGQRLPVVALKVLMAVVLFIVSAAMYWRAS
jgi:uncharacterized membrane protein YfcA